jgi:hypothetical protein
MLKILAPAFALVIAMFSISCTRQARHVAAVRHHLKNYDSISLSENLDQSFRSFFSDRKGGALSKAAYIATLGGWDLPLHPDYEILDIQFKGDTVLVAVIERNDFSKAINFPGWNATIEVVVSNKGKIVEQLYKPETSPDYKIWLAPALNWLRQNRQKDFARVYDMDNKRMIQNKETAQLWVELLSEWRKQDPINLQKANTRPGRFDIP